MKVGDLVIPRSDPPNISLPTDGETVGIVMEVSADTAGDGTKQIWVRWSAHSDWSFEYSDGVEVVSENR